jgi:hypothetical protein
MEDILNKLNDLENRLQELKSVNHLKRIDEYYSITQLLERIIDRIYPEKDAKEIKGNLYPKKNQHIIYIGNEVQGIFLDDLNTAIRTINTIKNEYELFGFDDFKPLKEKVETEWQIGSDKFGYFKKKKSS